LLGESCFPKEHFMTQKSRQSREMVKAIVNPMFAWSNAVLKGGEMMLNSMEALAKNARTVRVAVLPDADAPPRKRSARKNARSGGGKRAKRRR
jgi:hypothetical protein